MKAGVPTELERLISRCHRKDPAKRVQTMADLRVALEDLRDELHSGRVSGVHDSPAVQPRARRSRVIAAGMVLAVLAGGAGAALWLRPAGTPRITGTIHRVTVDMGLATDPAVSANGSLLAFASDRHSGTSLDVWVQPTGGGEPVRVTTSSADDREPSFSPDGSRIVFRSEREGGGIYVVPALGGPERLLVRGGRGPRFSPDGRWLSYWVGGRGATSVTIYVMPAQGGVPQPVYPDYSPRGAAIWSPDGRHLLFAGSSAAQPESSVDLWVAPISDDGKPDGPPTPVRASDRLRQSTAAFDGSSPGSGIESTSRAARVTEAASGAFR